MLLLSFLSYSLFLFTIFKHPYYSFSKFIDAITAIKYKRNNFDKTNDKKNTGRWMNRILYMILIEIVELYFDDEFYVENCGLCLKLRILILFSGICKWTVHQSAIWDDLISRICQLHIRRFHWVKRAFYFTAFWCKLPTLNSLSRGR